MGQRQPPGARPRADRRAGVQARAHPAHRRRRARRLRRGLHRRPVRPPGPGLRGRADGRVLQLRERAGCRPAPRTDPREPDPDAIDGRRPAARRGRAARCSSWAPTCGRTAPRRPPSGSSRRSASRRSPTAWAAALVPGGHPLLVTKARGQALGTSDLVVVVGTPLDFRLGLRRVRRARTGPTPARVVHLADSPGQVSGHAELAALGVRRPDLGPRRAARGRRPARASGPTGTSWVARPPGCRSKAAVERDAALLRRRGRPDPPGAHLRRAGAPAGRRRGRDRGRRRLRLLRGQVRRAAAPRRLARPRPLRLPRRRSGRRHRRPPRPAVGAGDPAARRRRGRLLADGRRHPGPPRPAGRDGDGQQRGLGPGEGPDADALRLRRRRRPLPRHVVRRRRARARRRRRDRRPTRARSARPSTAPTPPASPTWSTW